MTYTTGMRNAKLFLCIAVAGWLLACQPRPPAEAMLDDYLTRLARVLDVERPAIGPIAPPRMPPARKLRVDIAPLSINLLEFWGFRKCGLAEVLGERNSVLGRVMVPSQHLHMDGRILQQLRYCQRTLEDEELLALAGELETAKARQWPARYWNATVAAPELRAFWSPSTRPLVPGNEASYRSAESALAYLEQLPDRLANARWPSQSDLEQHYKALERYKLGGKLLQSLELGRLSIEAGNRMLAAAAAQRTLCPAGLQKKELEYARNVMSKVFAGQVQPWLAAVNRRTSSLFPVYDRLLAGQDDTLAPRITPFQSSLHQLHHRFREALREHVDHWQQLFETCGSKARPGV